MRAAHRRPKRQPIEFAPGTGFNLLFAIGVLGTAVRMGC
jgi:hypothetical protein